MSDDEHEEPSPVTAFLAPLELGQHRAVMKRLGYDNPADFAVQTPEDAQDMKSALKEELVPMGHVSRIMRAASATGLSTARLPQPASHAAEMMQVAPVQSVSGPALGITESMSTAQSALVQTAIADASAKRDKLHADQVRQQVAHAAFQSFKAPLMRAAHGACAV